MQISFEQSYFGFEKEVEYAVIADYDQQTKRAHEKRHSLKVEVPAGISSGQYIKFTAKGNA